MGCNQRTSRRRATQRADATRRATRETTPGLRRPRGLPVLADTRSPGPPARSRPSPQCRAGPRKRRTWAPERLLADLERLALRAPTRAELFDEAAARLKRTVPFDGACWHTLDPGSDLITQHRLQDLPDRFPVLANNEYAAEDVNKFDQLARAERKAATMNEATGGHPERSQRFRDLLTPAGLGPELRCAFVADGATWGALIIVSRAAASGALGRHGRRRRTLGFDPRRRERDENRDHRRGRRRRRRRVDASELGSEDAGRHVARPPRRTPRCPALSFTESLAGSLRDASPPAAASEEVGFGLPQRRRGRRLVQVLRGDSAPVRAGPELLQNDGDDAMHPPDQDRFGRQGELVHLHLHRGPLLPVGTLAVPAATGVVGREATLTWHRVPLDRHSHQAQRPVGVDRVRPTGRQITAREQRRLQGRRVPVADRAGDRPFIGHAAGVDIAQQAEVQKTDPAVGTQEIVTGMRVPEGDPVAIEQTEEEPEDDLAVTV